MINSMITTAMDNTTMKRVTITLPGFLYELLRKKVKPGQVSDYVAGAVQTRIVGDVVQEFSNPWNDFLAWRERLPKYSTNEILESIHQGRK